MSIQASHRLSHPPARARVRACACACAKEKKAKQKVTVAVKVYGSTLEVKVLHIPPHKGKMVVVVVGRRQNSISTRS